MKVHRVEKGRSSGRTQSSSWSWKQRNGSKCRRKGPSRETEDSGFVRPEWRKQKTTRVGQQPDDASPWTTQSSGNIGNRFRPKSRSLGNVHSSLSGVPPHGLLDTVADADKSLPMGKASIGWCTYLLSSGCAESLNARWDLDWESRLRDGASEGFGESFLVARLCETRTGRNAVSASTSD